MSTRFQALITAGKVTGKTTEFLDELNKDRDDDRWGAEGELIEYEIEAAHGTVITIQGKNPGGDLPKVEIKTRTQPFTSAKNFQNFIKDRITAADTQLGSGGGELRINLHTFTDLLGATITAADIEMAIKAALKSRRGVGANVNNILVRNRSKVVIYSGKPTP